MRSEGGGRLYLQGGVTRLSVIKQLVDSGHAIGIIAELSMEQLRERLADTRLTDRSFAVRVPKSSGGPDSVAVSLRGI